MRALVCGGRYFANIPYHVGDTEELQRLLEQKNRDIKFLMDTLDHQRTTRKITSIGNGDAVGADRTSSAWAELNDIPVDKFPITKGEWVTYGKAAGPMRNARMLKVFNPGIVIAFRGGTGTENMILLAKYAGVEVFRAGT